jgi:hypothetical protein
MIVGNQRTAICLLQAMTTLLNFCRRTPLHPFSRLPFAATAFFILFVAAATLLSATSLPALPRPNSPAPDDAPRADTIGVIDGESIAVSGPMSVEVVHGQVKTILRSGSDVRVKTGIARIELVEGGLITICAPAHLSILKSGGALTVALETGTIHIRIQRAPAVTIFTAQIKAQPLAIGDDLEDLLVGFDSAGVMCIRATRGAVRLEQQLTGQSVLVPQSGDVLLTNGQLDTLNTSNGRCACELATEKISVNPQTEVSQLATSEDLRKKNSDPRPVIPAPVEKPAPREEPIYQVVVPPLMYDANAKVQAEIDPALIVLVRRVRVRPTVIFQGRVLEEPPAPSLVAAATPLTSARPTQPKSAPATPSVVDRVRTYLHNLWSKTP